MNNPFPDEHGAWLGAGMERGQQIGNAACAVMTGVQGHRPSKGVGRGNPD